MTEQEAIKLIKDFIEKNLNADAIKNIYIRRIINCNTLDEIGFTVTLQLNGEYTYPESVLSKIKKIIKAKTFVFKIVGGKMIVIFKCYYNERNKSNIKKSLV